MISCQAFVFILVLYTSSIRIIIQYGLLANHKVRIGQVLWMFMHKGTVEKYEQDQYPTLLGKFSQQNTNNREQVQISFDIVQMVI